MHPSTAPARQPLSRRVERLGTGAVGTALGMASLAAIVERAGGGGALSTMLAALLSVAAFLLGWLASRLGETRRLAALLAENGRDVITRWTATAVSPMSPRPPSRCWDTNRRPSSTAARQPLPPGGRAGARQAAGHRATAGTTDRSPVSPPLRPDGRWQPAELHLAPARRGEIVCVLRDVTRWQAAMTLARRSTATSAWSPNTRGT